MMDGWGAPGWGMGFGLIFMILFWGLIIFGVIAIIKWLAGASGKAGTAAPKSARQVLDERYARGEIDREEFEQKKRDLEP